MLAVLIPINMFDKCQNYQEQQRFFGEKSLFNTTRRINLRKGISLRQTGLIGPKPTKGRKRISHKNCQS